MNRVIVAIGSNINPYENVKRAKELISLQHKVIRSSKFIMTKPIGYTAQDDFLNGGLLVHTNFDKKPFKSYLRDIEDKLGRERTENKYGPRTIDLDILIWNGTVVDKDYYDRDFLQSIVKELDVELYK
ncbi:MAG TPA: 2-amino-4-hydroxy-6-hydroxymethyldihydropteridine diphosphokinase [Thermodesulfobacteriota bacterium]|nr:2-amino-4-hydroxy-6-hydroxymethyldihydropteridine diphosphokinase [Thermodesulfobacteriota bacterium]